MKKILFLIIVSITNSYSSNYNELLFNGNCVTCHFKNKAVSAPSVEEFKQRYIAAFPLKEDFVLYMSTWVQYPKVETSLMDDAIKKYELMPELGFDLDSLKKISEYIYETDFKNNDK
ncbi:MAG: cytochrome C [Campylobacterota bacterium]|nr:cytochrome C [Campylobacterota bacterium]